jgi:hypothetical protein
LIDDDEIAERIAEMIRETLANLRDDPMGRSVEATNLMDASEAYCLAYVPDVRERAKVRRQAKRVRKLVFAKLGVGDRAALEK